MRTQIVKPNLLQFSNGYNTLVCRASRGTRANLGLMACCTYVKTAIHPELKINEAAREARRLIKQRE